MLFVSTVLASRKFVLVVRGHSTSERFIQTSESQPESRDHDKLQYVPKHLLTLRYSQN